MFFLNIGLTYSDRKEKMEKGIKILAEFKATALTELDTVSNSLALDFFSNI